MTALLAAGRARSKPTAILPADWVTLARALLIAAVAGLVADSFTRTTQVTALVVLASIALALDAVDGQVARRTGTATPFGARLDGEVDAFLILVLSVEVSRDYGAWVLAIGAFRYVFLVAGFALPWLAAPLPPRYWGRVAAAVQGVVLTVAASGLVSRPVGMVAVGIALVVLAGSFGHVVVWLYRIRAGPV
jgi:phosphatidylglycerophosphate synthase